MFLPKEKTRGGGGLSYKKGRVARRKFQIKPLKETNFHFTPKETILKHRETKNTVTFNNGKDIII